MTTVKDLKEWLNRFPDDTIVEFAIQEPASPYQSYGSVNFEEPELTDNDEGKGWSFIDFTNNKFVKPEEDYYGKKYLRIGEED